MSPEAPRASDAGLVNATAFIETNRLDALFSRVCIALPLPHNERRYLAPLPRDHQPRFVAQQLDERFRRLHTLLQLETVDSRQNRFGDHLSAQNVLEPIHQEREWH